MLLAGRETVTSFYNSKNTFAQRYMYRKSARLDRYFYGYNGLVRVVILSSINSINSINIISEGLTADRRLDSPYNYSK